MKIFLFISFLFLISCNIEETEPQIIEEYFFKKKVINPIIQPTASQLEGLYIVKRTANNGKEFAQKELKLEAIDKTNMFFKIYRTCLIGCTTNDLDPYYLSRYPNLSIEDKINIKIEGFGITIPNQQFKVGDGFNTSIINIYEGKGKISIDKRTITISYKLSIEKEVGSINYSYSFTKKN